MRGITKLFAAAVAALALAACGAGGGGSSAPQPPVVQPPPVYDAVPATYPAGSEQLAALQVLNARRTAAGLPPLIADTRLTNAADGHAAYIILHKDNEAVRASPHRQIPGTAGFTGERAQDRATSAGYMRGVGEVIAGGDTGQQLLDALFASQPHRDLLMHPDARHVGVAAQLGVIKLGFPG